MFALDLDVVDHLLLHTSNQSIRSAMPHCHQLCDQDCSSVKQYLHDCDRNSFTRSILSLRCFEQVMLSKHIAATAHVLKKGLRTNDFFGPSPTFHAPITRAFSFTFTSKNYMSRHLSIPCSHHLSHCHCSILSRSQVEIQEQI